MVEISALKGTGIMDAAAKAVELAKAGGKAAPVHEFGPEVEHVLDEIEASLGDDIPEAQKRFYAIKLFERDDKIAARMTMVPDVERLIKGAEDAMDDDAESIITNERYTYIASIINGCYVRKNRQKLSTSDKIDHIVTNRWLALPILQWSCGLYIMYRSQPWAPGQLTGPMTGCSGKAGACLAWKYPEYLC